MRSIKLMCSGIFLVAAAAFCAAIDGGNGSLFGAAAILLPVPGVVLFVLGLIKKED